MALGSSAEMQVWLDYALALRYISQKNADVWQEKYDYISAMLRKLRNS
jgi:four helix bundle protein